jgi:hypothetical protein
MAKAAATQLPSFTTRQDAEESEAALCPPGTKSKKESAVTSRDPWTSGRQTCLSRGSGAASCEFTFVNTTRSQKVRPFQISTLHSRSQKVRPFQISTLHSRSQKSGNSRSQQYIPGPKQVILVFNVLYKYVILGNYIINFDLK